MKTPCQHLGARTGRKELCVLCGGKEMELVACAKHGECTQEKQLVYKKDGHLLVEVPWCVTCKDYEPTNP